MFFSVVIRSAVKLYLFELLIKIYDLNNFKLELFPSLELFQLHTQLVEILKFVKNHYPYFTITYFFDC